MTNAERTGLIKDLENQALATYRRCREDGATPEDAAEQAIDETTGYLESAFPGITARWDAETLRVAEVAGDFEAETVETRTLSDAELLALRAEAA